MFRKSLFWGLTIVLVAALASLIIRGRRLEREQADQPLPVVRQVQPSPIRVISPQDLEIEGSTMQQPSADSAVHEVEIRNSGNVSYSAIQLEFTYLDKTGKFLATRKHTLERVDIKPGQSFSSTGIPIQGVPGAASRCRVSILSADLSPASAQ
jgi:hypothetical protein